MIASVFAGSLQIHGSNPKNGIALRMPLTGVGLPPERLSQYDKPGEDGGVISNAFYGTRLVGFDGVVVADSAAGHESLRDQLAAAFANVKDANGFPVPTKFILNTNGGQSFFFYGNTSKLVMESTYPTTSDFLAEVAVADPNLYINQLLTSGAISVPAGGGFILPVIVPIIWSGSSGGQTSVVNNGSARVWPVLTFQGPLTNPYVLNSTVGRSFAITRTLAATDVLVVDMGAKTVMLNGNSIIQQKTSDSQWWWLAPGSNQLAFSTGSSSDTGTLTVTYYSAKVNA